MQHENKKTRLPRIEWLESKDVDPVAMVKKSLRNMGVGEQVTITEIPSIACLDDHDRYFVADIFDNHRKLKSGWTIQNIMGLTCLKGDIKPLNDDDADTLTKVVQSSEYEAFLIDIYQSQNLGVLDVMSRNGSPEVWNMTLSDMYLEGETSDGVRLSKQELEEILPTIEERPNPETQQKVKVSVYKKEALQCPNNLKELM